MILRNTLETLGAKRGLKGNVDGAVCRNNSSGSAVIVFCDGNRVYMGSSAIFFPGVSELTTPSILKYKMF
jgi:hypothetical protein